VWCMHAFVSLGCGLLAPLLLLVLKEVHLRGGGRGCEGPWRLAVRVGRATSECGGVRVCACTLVRVDVSQCQYEQGCRLILAVWHVRLCCARRRARVCVCV
jgi:hypothetical protein